MGTAGSDNAIPDEDARSAMRTRPGRRDWRDDNAAECCGQLLPYSRRRPWDRHALRLHYEVVLTWSCRACAHVMQFERAKLRQSASAFFSSAREMQVCLFSLPLLSDSPPFLMCFFGSCLYFHLFSCTVVVCVDAYKGKSSSWSFS